jgi:hypothetical protein
MLDGAVTITDNGSAAAGESGSINGLSWSGSQMTSCLYSLSPNVASPHYPRTVAWNNLACTSSPSPTNAQPAQNPNYANIIPFNYGWSSGTVGSNTCNNLLGYYGGGNGGISGQLCSSGYEVYFESYDQTVDIMDIAKGGVTVNKPLTAPSLAINGGTAMTGSVGTGGYAQETTSAAKTSGHFSSYDANQSIVDSGIATSAVPQVGTPTVNSAACIKAAGPPVVIGYCSTVVSSTGTCTCN